MQFLNIALLGGAFAFAVPLIIHLLNRSRFRTIEWGAMHLLDSVVTTNSRRIKLEQLLLLLVRCAIPIALATCLAMPVLTGAKSLPGDAPSSTVLLIDNSYSMDAPGKSGTRIGDSKRDAKSIVDSLGKGSDVSVVLVGGEPTTLFDTPVFDTEAVSDQIDFLESGRGRADWARSLQLGGTLLSQMSCARRNLIVISDFQSRDVESLTVEQFERFRELTKTGEIETSVSLIHRTGERPRNLAVQRVEQAAAVVGINQTLKLRVEVKNYNELPVTDLLLHLKVNDQLVDQTQIEVAADATSQALFTHRFDKPGSNVVEIQLDAGDDITTDDRYLLAVDVLESIRVLLIDGDPRSGAMESETDFLNIALTPFQSGRMKLADLVETRVVSSSEVSEANLTWAQVAIVANVSQFNDERLKDLAAFAHRGGGLIVFLGTRVNVDWYNNVLHERERLLSGSLHGMGGGPRDDDVAGKIVAQHFDHPSLQIFNSGNSELADVDIRQWYRLRETPVEESRHTSSDTTHQNVESGVLMKLDNGDPLFVEQSYGRGTIITCATSADPDWSNLPLRPLFVPLIQQLVTGIATRGMPNANLMAGETLVARLPLDSDSINQVLSLPSGKQTTVRGAVADQGDYSIVRYEKTVLPGIYTLTQPGSPPRHFAFEVDRSESEAETLSDQELHKFAEKLDADIVADGEAYIALESKRRYGREIWRWVLAGLVALLFLELFLQQKFARVRA